jgi:crotonobetainyl-CoA:carnitine CoA-transferase CaiB-like acyl-CoA transferase
VVEERRRSGLANRLQIFLYCEVYRHACRHGTQECARHLPLASYAQIRECGAQRETRAVARLRRIAGERRVGLDKNPRVITQPRYPSQFMATPLEGLRVLDFSHALAGPFCTMLMAQYGADVYKIESLDGELGRSWAPPFVEGEAAFFLGVNAGKRSLAINLKKPEGLALCLEMIAHADVLIENMRPGTLDRLGLGYAAARALNPRLIYCSVSGYGQNGPSRDDPAMDLILQAASGLISVTGVEDGEQVRCGHSVADITSGMFALIGILLAIEARNRTGEGQLVDVSMLDSMISAMASNYANFFGANYDGARIVPGPLGTRFGTIVPYRGFPTADRDIVIAVASGKLWVDFCGAIGRPDLAEHPDYGTNALRVKNREVLEPLIASIFRTRPSAHWVAHLRACGIPCAPVKTLDEVGQDPQAAERGMFPEVGGFTVTGPPVKLSATPGSIPRPAPHLGEHTREALVELLGCDDAALDRMESSGVIRGRVT